ncbi:MAG: M48 family metallopeptidase [Nitrospirae bacterium]|nr:M48 family metallopeptidase [Nitrospirota bacterium]
MIAIENIYLILIIYILKETFEYTLQFLNLGYMKRFGSIIPDVFKGKINESHVQKMRAYEIEKTKFSFISSIFGNAVTIIFIFGGLLNIYDDWISSFNFSFILSGVFFFLFLSYANTLLTIPFSLYNIFRIENKYGFNTMTIKLWFADFLKSILLSTVITGILLFIGFLLIQLSPTIWWFWLWIFFLIYSLFIMYISPYVIEPLFNKFSPIEEKVLEDRIKDLMKKINIRVSSVFKMDASKRSRHTNAYFTGIGKVKRIILYDTLLEKMNHDEILAILAHEAGHWKKKHVLKMIVASETLAFIAIYLSFRILSADFLTDIFQIKNATFFTKVLLLGFMGNIISLPFLPISNYFSRRFEKEADRFACKLTGDKEAFKSALIKLSIDNLSNLHPHPFYAAFYYSHPPVIQRIKEIENFPKLSS